MATLSRLKIRWEGFTGGPGVSVVYSTGIAATRAAWSAALNGLKDYHPTLVTWTIEDSGDEIESTTGVMTGNWISGSPITYTGTQTGGYAAPVGYSIRWSTATFFAGKRLRGRTFMVPADGTIFGSDGTIDATALAAIRGHVATLVGSVSTNQVIWKRPKAPGTGGFATVDSALVADTAAILSSRR